ncbi:MAG: recombinase family protein [Chloroflexi bacterium]|nr:recombinase family protein [Chloroflexota bacterium]
MKRVETLITGVYARVSSSKQREEKTIESQVASLSKYAQEQGYRVASDYIFRDDGYSGSVLVRPGLERLRDLGSEGQLDVILIYSPDRLSRKYAYQVLLLEEFNRNGVEVVFINSPQATTPEEALLLQFQGMISEYERAQITERSRRGKKHKAKCGLVNALSKAPYGYRYIKKGESTCATYEVVEREAETVREIYRLYAEELLSLGAIARYLGEQGVPTRTGKKKWSSQTIYNMIKNPAYKGTACYGKTERTVSQRINRTTRRKGGFPKRASSRPCNPKEWIEIPVPCIVSAETFALAAERLKRNKRQSARNTKVFTLLQGFLVCKECGYSLYKSISGKNKYYRCLGSDNNRFPDGRVCNSHPIRQDYLDELIWENIIGFLDNPLLIGEELERRRQEVLNSKPTQMRRETLKNETARATEAMKKLLDAYQEGLVELDELRSRMAVLKKRTSKLNSELQSLEAKVIEQRYFMELSLKIEDFSKSLRASAKSLGVLERRKILKLVVKDVLVGEEEITIRHSIPLAGAIGENTKSYQVCKGHQSD